MAAEDRPAGTVLEVFLTWPEPSEHVDIDAVMSSIADVLLQHGLGETADGELRSMLVNRPGAAPRPSGPDDDDWLVEWVQGADGRAPATKAVFPGHRPLRAVEGGGA